MKQRDEQMKIEGRTYRLDLKRCIQSNCEGELAEISYYERNNWATFELQCNTCKKKFVVKVES